MCTNVDALPVMSEGNRCMMKRLFPEGVVAIEKGTECRETKQCLSAELPIEERSRSEAELFINDKTIHVRDGKRGANGVIYADRGVKNSYQGTE